MAMILCYVQRKRLRGNEGRTIFVSTIGFAFCLLPIACASFFIRHFGSTAMLIWIFATFGIGVALTLFAERGGKNRG